MKKYHSSASHYARQKRGTAVADKLRSFIVRLSFLLIMNLPTCRCNTYQQDTTHPQVECSITLEPETFHLDLKVQR